MVNQAAVKMSSQVQRLTLQTRVLLYTIAITSTSHLRNVSVRRDTGIVFGCETQQETTKYYPINI